MNQVDIIYLVNLDILVIMVNLVNMLILVIFLNQVNMVEPVNLADLLFW